MTKATSFYLDCLRGLAAILVFFHHFSTLVLNDGIWIPGHAAVVLFFVLSGYVIAYSTLDRENVDLRRYTVARLSRLYSVAVPALVLTGISVALGGALFPLHYNYHYYSQYNGPRLAVTTFFLQSIWGVNASPRADAPFWSLSYEFWYYVLFGIVVFIRQWKVKWALLFLTSLLVGLPILLLLPIWSFGVWLYVCRDKFSVSPRSAAVALVFSLIATVAMILWMPPLPFPVESRRLSWASAFLTDWAIGVGAGASIWFFARSLGHLKISGGWTKPVRWMAGHSFSLYLYHYPILVFINSMALFNPSIWWRLLLEMALVFALIILLSEWTEAKRKTWEKGFAWLFQKWGWVGSAADAGKETAPGHSSVSRG